MRKNILVFMVAGVMMMAMTACGGSDKEKTTEQATEITTEQSTSEESTEETTEEETEETTTQIVGDFAAIGSTLFIVNDNGMNTFKEQVDSNKIKEVVIKEGVTFIGDESFADFSEMINITIPSTVTSVGEDAFRNCDKLVSIVLPDSITTLGEGTFAACDSLESVTLPKGIKEIPKRFMHNTGIKELTIPEGVEVIRESAFAYSSYLKKVVISEGVTTIEYNAFDCCSELENMYLPSTIDFMGFAGVPRSEKIVVYGVAGSVVEKRCKEWGMTFVAQ